MITITKGNNSYMVEGHSKYAEKGRDIVCASISAITQTAMLGLAEYVQVRYQEHDGYLHVRFPEQTAETEAILTAMYLGIEQIIEQYPQYVMMIEMIEEEGNE